MITIRPLKRARIGGQRSSPRSNGRFGPRESQGIASLWRMFGPYLVASVFLALGYVYYLGGTAYSLSAEHYRTWAFPAFRYSDLIWMYLRDELDLHPVPYVDYPLEYPPLTGLLTWVLSWAPDLPAYFTLAYVALAASALLAIWALQHLSGANVWLFAASPALFFYTGHQWDMAAIGVAALALYQLHRGRYGWGVAGLVVATSLKLFPVVFVAAAVVERIRDRRFRSAAAIALGFVAGTVLINLPVALANFDGWSFFFRWNRDRLADSGIWVLWRGVPTGDLTRWSLVAAVAGGVALTALALRSRGPLLAPLGATYLLWWLLVNKTFTTHLMLWAFLALALLSAPWWLWGLTTAADLVGFQLGNFLNLYNVPAYQHAPLIRKAVENIYDPVQIARSVALFACALWGIHVLRLERLRARYAARKGVTAAGLLQAGREAVAGNGRPQTARELKSGRGLAATAGDAGIAPTGKGAGAIRLRQGILSWIGLALLFLVAAVVMTWPYARRLGDATVVGFDPLLQVWLSEWVHHALLTNPLGLYDANIFYPFPQTLAYTDANLPGALLALLPRVVTGDPILANSLLVLASFVLAGTGTFALVEYLTGNRGAAIVAGLAYAFLPYRMVHLWHLNWLEGAWLPWLVLTLLRLVDRPSPGRALVLGLLAAALVLTSFYFSVQIVLMCGVVLIARAIATRQLPSAELTRGLVVAAAVAAAIAIPLYVPYLQVQQEQGLERSIVDAEQYKATPASYLQIAPWDEPNPLQRLLGVRAGPNESLTEVGQARHADGHQHAEIVIEDALYPGAVVMLFAVVGVFAWRERRWLAIALAVVGAVALLLSLGPTLGPRHGDGAPLPYGWLFDHVPFFRAMRVPARLGGLADFALVLLAGLGMAAAWGRVQASARYARATRNAWVSPLLTVILAAVVLADLWTGTVPLEGFDRGTEASAAARWLATQPPGPVMEFPAESVFADPAAASVRRHYGEAMFWSTLHWKPLVNGNSGFIPRAYSDLIERFVGELDRPGRSRTGRISHLNRETVPLLHQLGVRYLVFHRAQYRDEDWPAVISGLEALIEDGTLSPQGEHGEALVFVLNPATPAPPAPRVSLFAPTLITPESAWSPWVGVENLAGGPAVLSLTRVPTLETTWYDDDGRFLWRESRRLALPVVVDDPYLLCNAECLTSRSFDDLARFPPPEVEGSWNPESPGHYVVRLRLSGDHPLECRIDLDLVADDDEVEKRSPGQPYRWAQCVTGQRNPVNDPGALPFDLSPPSVTLVDNIAVVDIAVTPREDEEVRGWFILAPPNASQPWKEPVFQSQVLQKLLLADEPAAFEWQAAIDDTVEPGVYELTVWFHRRAGEGWEHAAGGDIELAPVVVDEDRHLRWAGPVRVRLAEIPEPLAAGRSTRLDLAVSGTSREIGCIAAWRLFAGSSAIASGNAGPCDEVGIVLPPTIGPGEYRLQLDVFAERGGDVRLSDAVSVPVTVVGSGHGGQPS